MLFMKALVFCVVSGLFLATTARVHSQAFSFTTLAGSASQGSTDGSVTNARFFAPQDVSVDAQGNVYVADSDNSTIREITPGGLVPGPVERFARSARYRSQAHASQMNPRVFPVPARNTLVAVTLERT